MVKTKFGVSASLHPEKIPAPEEILNFAVQAENCGYDSLWMGDHVAFHGHYTDSLTTLAAFAVKTSKITQVTNTFRKIYPKIQEEVLSRGHIDNLYTGSLM